MLQTDAHKQKTVFGYRQQYSNILIEYLNILLQPYNI